MSSYRATNVTKHEAGSSGDNVIPDGYVHTVEKVWIDYYSLVATALSTADTIEIARIAPNKKITGVEVYLSTAITPTNSTINVGVTGDTDKFISGASLIASPEVISMNNADGFGYVTTGSTPTSIYLSIGTVAVTAPTTGTIYTIVRYT